MSDVTPMLLMTSPHARWARLGDAVHVDTPDVACTFEEAGAAMTVWLDRLRHGTMIAEGPSRDTWLDTLVEHGAVCALPAVHADADAYLRDMSGICDRWMAGIFASPFWPRFQSGASSEVQVLAFLAQLYHRTAGADVHNRVAVERCSAPQMRPWLLRRYREGRGHATMLAAGLLRCGPSARTFLDSGAFEATHALVDFMIEAAGDTLNYLGCHALFDAPSAQLSDAEIVAQFNTLARRYPFAAPGFEAVCAHARQGDAPGRPDAALERWVRDVGMPGPDERLRILRGAQGVACAFREVFDVLHRLDEDD
ncbi:hypothetical protein PTE30175_01631 [Pandoraea terrae]|uniref:Uncharacterized protein n=1 Tax=Pandoraea terrae TaxID=1537710 RepID=A0A5E4U0E1_9BURK|nr:hypothetical protein [Pandoraea terrae]VVD92478.1 hypothetical protein PTE30175_01631 [Pandoraea terrae]